MLTVHKIHFRNVWLTLPDVAFQATVPELPNTTLEHLDYDLDENRARVPDFTNDALKQIALNAAPTFDGLTLDFAAVNALPDDYFLKLYEHLNYELKVGGNEMPITQNNTTSLSPYAVSGLILGSLMFHGLVTRLHPTTDRTKEFLARRYLTVARRLDYALYKALERHPEPLKSETPVIATATGELTVGDFTEAFVEVYFDYDLASELEANGTDLKQVALNYINDV